MTNAVRFPAIYFGRQAETLRHLRMVRAIEPHYLAAFGDPEKTINRAIESLTKLGRIKAGDKLVIISDVLTQSNRRIESIQLRTVE